MRQIGEVSVWGEAESGMISLARHRPRPFHLPLPLDHNSMRPHTAAWQALSLLQRAPVRCNSGRRAIQTATSARVPNFAFAFE